MKFHDILADIGDGVQYILHAHTQFCDGRAPMEDFIREASHLCMTHYGFTPHSPIPFESTCNMSKADVPLYFAEIQRLAEKYPDIKILRGMEVDYLDSEWNAANDYFRSLDLDYTISSVHFIPTQDGRWVDIDGRPESFLVKYREMFHSDIEYIVSTFFRHSLEMVETGGFDIIGHFDKIKLNASYVDPDIELRKYYVDGVNALVGAIITHHVAVEINTKSWKEFGHFFPAQRHWRTLLKAGVPIVVNSDVHYPDRINAGRPEVLKALRYLKQTI